MRKHSWKFYAAMTACTIAAMHIINRIIFTLSGEQNLLFSHNGHTYSWRLGDIFYTKQGQGKPVLLIHDLDYAASDMEYRYMVKELAENHTVYTMDLLGCGRSDKPAMTYTAYAYVQLITDFAKEIIGEQTDIIASGNSANLAILSAYSSPDLFDHINLINPVSIRKQNKIPKKCLTYYKKLLETPIIGTFLYNIASSKLVLKYRLSQGYYYPYVLKNKTLTASYEAAHRGDANAKYLFASKRARYTNSNMLHALSAMKNPITLIVGEDEINGAETANDFVEVNNRIQVNLVANSKHFPQIEQPEDTIQQLDL